MSDRAATPITLRPRPAGRTRPIPHRHSLSTKTIGAHYPRLQIVTVEELLNGRQIDMPPSSNTFKQAEKVGNEFDGQGALFSDQ